MKFTEEETIHFSELYRECECLWNMASPDYKNKRQRAIESIIEDMGMLDMYSGNGIADHNRVVSILLNYGTKTRRGAGGRGRGGQRGRGDIRNNMFISNLLKENEITVINANMYNVIDQFKNDSSVAFAHSISNDFNHDRHMSAGVAVVFRNKFGRPLRSECITKNLACQKIPNGAFVYSLITKDNYYDKPTLQNYNLAFQQLRNNFKSQGLKTLICSPIGCVRDLINPHDFVENIVKLHKETGATVCVISYEQKTAQRPLWKGLTHQQFLKTLEETVLSQVDLATTPI